ncbi:DUF7524 family protein [Methanocorpusculum vombati]|uniref:Uncharacterized protein n=1 Tax=Methanocorpusculum vombati TaxID=3002864 RepID=A0ABT4IJ97_9EURY|nr:hypothetical protein [Methanocorpusculum vombati]MCZ9319919.1 hypothetical protein [Methanocorpusculum sp.]MCZ0861806.1 hypothetical protein [Methanocorpusculum vombati]MDE2521224.1 hypothetical protein [Methanocorpusculum sp.]MDE2534961.1 hypothetical protein [Methanocorpusculum sp.]MDE2545509.1 hypothetical protein [Methanocorpusculum sp.]
MAIVEIQLNRLGINSLELSTDAVDVSAGTALHIRFVNHGSPTHATLRCEASAYTDFTYENIYVEGESELEIKMKEDAGTGSFDMQVITGYGMRREAFTINVLKSCPVAPSPEPVIFPEEPVAEPKRRSSSLNAGAGKAVMMLIMPIIAAIIIVLWQFFSLNIDGLAMTIVVYLIMLAGVIIAWHSAQ